MSKFKPILVLDFDGVIHSYTSGWQGADVVSDPPVPGTADALESYLENFEVHVLSSRTSQEGGVRAMKEWMTGEFGPKLVEQIKFPEHKPPAFLTIDDRVERFTGTWPEASELLAFKPWNKR